jgi:uncharacterized protein YbjT (DUF2867 family)
MKILILGAAGQIGRMLTEDLLRQTEHTVVLYAREANRRLQSIDSQRITIQDGDFKDNESLAAAMEGVDLIYLNAMDDRIGILNILATMQEKSVKRIVVSSILGIYDEVPGAFGKWNKQMVGEDRIQKHASNASLIEVDQLDYTILRLTWLYNKKDNRKYLLTQKGEPFQGAQVTRQAVSQLIVDIINEPTSKFLKTSLGVSEPNTNWNKPSFY